MSETPLINNLAEFKKKYRLGCVLGEGNFSVVRECFVRENDKFSYAVKVIKLKGNKQRNQDVQRMIQREISIMQKIKNANIIQFIETFNGNEEVFIVLEGTKGGDLYDHIINRKEIDEQEASCILIDITNAVKYLHEMQIVHRDIKPENFLLFQLPNGENTVKLCDFGLAADARQLLTEVCGSPSYVAPEVLRMENYGLPVDIWSCGIVTYVLLCHFPPFFADDTRQLFRKIIKGNYDFPSPYWDNISDDAKDLVSQMLIMNTDNRIKAKDVLLHPWLQKSKQTENEKSSDDQGGKKPCSMTLRSVAIAVRCAQRFAIPVLKPTRERAILTASFVEACNSK